MLAGAVPLPSPTACEPPLPLPCFCYRYTSSTSAAAPVTGFKSFQYQRLRRVFQFREDRLAIPMFQTLSRSGWISRGNSPRDACSSVSTTSFCSFSSLLSRFLSMCFSVVLYRENVWFLWKRSEVIVIFDVASRTIYRLYRNLMEWDNVVIRACEI